MRTDKVTLRARTIETAEALATLGPTAAHEAMRAKYAWSRRTWFHYQARAYAYLAEHAQCPEEARNALIVLLQRFIADPTCNHAARARYTDQLAKLQGAYAPTLIDSRVLTAEVSPWARQDLTAEQRARLAELAHAQALLLAPPVADRPREALAHGQGGIGPQNAPQEVLDHAN